MDREEITQAAVRSAQQRLDHAAGHLGRLMAVLSGYAPRPGEPNPADALRGLSTDLGLARSYLAGPIRRWDAGHDHPAPAPPAGRGPAAEHDRPAVDPFLHGTADPGIRVHGAEYYGGTAAEYH